MEARPPPPDAPLISNDSREFGLMALARRGTVAAASAASPAGLAPRTSCDPSHLCGTIGPMDGAAERAGAASTCSIRHRALAAWRPVNAGEYVCRCTAISASAESCTPDQPRAAGPLNGGTVGSGAGGAIGAGHTSDGRTSTTQDS